MGESAEKDLDVKTSVAVNDDSISQGNDLVIAVTSSSTITEDRSSGTVGETSLQQLGTTELDADKITDMDQLNEQIEEMPKLIETTEPKRPGKNAKFNLRKSLAWDSAFFTSDGVLDADELSTMIEGGEKGKKHQLPGIEEEVYRSMESISTLESDNLTLECLEAELFEDIRASIQKSNTKSNLNNSSSINVPSGKKDSQAKVSSSKKLDLDSLKKSTSRIKDYNTSSIPKPKIISKASSTSALTKRASLSANQVKKDQDLAKQAQVTQKGIQGLKTTTTGVINPRRGVPKPSPTSKSSSSLSCSNSSSSSSTNDSRRKIDPKNGSKLVTGQITKTPSRVGIKNKAPPVNARVSSHLMLSNLSSSVSPASSIDLSSESSSSTSINRRSVESIDSSLSMNTNENGNQVLSQSGSLSRPSSVQPTGLRMPSPKIGFFDGGKSGVRTPSGGAIRSQSRVPTTTNGVKIPPPKTNFMKPNPQKTVPKSSQEQPSTKSKTNSKVENDSDKSKMETFENVEVEKSVMDSTRIPFAVKNSVCDVSESGVEVNEKSGNFLYVEGGQHKENSEVV